MKPLVNPLTQSQLDSVWRVMAGGYIFQGVRSQGKVTVALELARSLNCRGDQPALCVSCRQLEAGLHPDLIRIEPESRASITIEQVRTLNHTLSLSPYYADGVRVVIIDGAHLLTPEAQNALLKLLEEPPPRTRFVLATERLEALLPTIRSRLATIHFGPVETTEIAALLVSSHGMASAEAAHLAELAAGAPGIAVRLAQDGQLAAVWAELEGAMATAMAPGLFERLTLARRLVDNKTDLELLSSQFHRVVVRQLRSGALSAAAAARRLGALERFRRGLTANLAPRVALERLMVEL